MRRNPDDFFFKRRVMCSLGCDRKGGRSAYQIGHANCDDAGSWCATQGWLSFESVKLPPIERLSKSEIADRQQAAKRKSAAANAASLRAA
jgi:hypothetical protein